jgi:cell wall-associated NlpC family hydrolase
MRNLKSLFGAASALVLGASRAAAQVPDELPPYIVPPEIMEPSDAMPPADPTAVARLEAPALRDSLVRAARSLIGRKYRYGGNRPETGLDCSGFVRYVMASLNIELPRTARDQAQAGHDLDIPRDTAALRPGDLLTFGKGKRASHVGIYVGDGKFVHASTKAGRVIESTLENPSSSLIRRWRGARRFVVTGDTVVVRLNAAN